MTTNVKNLVQTPDKPLEAALYLNTMYDIPWRNIAALEPYRGIPAGTLNSYCHGRPVKNETHRRILGLPPLVLSVNVYILVALVMYFKPPRPRIYHRLDTMPRWALRWQLENREEIK